MKNIVFIIMTNVCILFAGVSDSEKVLILTDYLIKEKTAKLDADLATTQNNTSAYQKLLDAKKAISAQARSEALATVYGKPRFKGLVYDSSSEMFFGRIISERGSFEQDINFYMPQRRALNFEKNVDAGKIEIKNALEDNQIEIKEIVLEYDGVTYPLASKYSNTFTLKVGGYFVADQSTEVLVKQNGVGAALDLQELFDLDKQSNILRVDMIYKFNPDHKIELSWYDLKNSSHKSVETSFEYNGEVIDAGAALDIYFDTQIIKLLYGYSAYHTTKLDLNFRAGFHTTTISTGIKAVVNAGAIDEQVKAESIAVTAPLPVVGFGLEYAITSAIRVQYKVDYFLLSYDNTVSGSLIDTVLSLEYQYNRYIGAGIGINTTKFRIKTVQDNSILEARHDVGGAIGYLIFSY